MLLPGDDLSQERRELSAWEGEYTLGYLMEKLGSFTGGANLHNYMDGCEASAMGIEVFADTLTDAACKLCIELFKQGILKAKSSKEKSGAKLKYPLHLPP